VMCRWSFIQLSASALLTSPVMTTVWPSGI
jgi:hypothetical protein